MVSRRQTAIAVPFTIERRVPMMDEAGVDRVVIVPPTLERYRLDYAQEACNAIPGRFAIMGRIALDSRLRRSHSDLEATARRARVRLNLIGDRIKWLTDGTADWLCRLPKKPAFRSCS